MAIKIKSRKHVTLPLLKLENNRPYYLRFLSPMTLGKQIDDKKEPATLLNVLDLETGEEAQIIVGAVLKGILEETYEGHNYQGKDFEVIKHHAGETGKKYSTYSLTEVEIDTDDGDREGMEAEAEAAAPAKAKGKK